MLNNYNYIIKNRNNRIKILLNYLKKNKREYKMIFNIDNIEKNKLNLIFFSKKTKNYFYTIFNKDNFIQKLINDSIRYDIELNNDIIEYLYYEIIFNGILLYYNSKIITLHLDLLTEKDIIKCLSIFNNKDECNICMKNKNESYIVCNLCYKKICNQCYDTLMLKNLENIVKTEYINDLKNNFKCPYCRNKY